MSRHFNVAGPCFPAEHYMIDASRRLGAEVRALIEEKQYFVIHAARQCGKTTLLLDLMEKINAEGKYYALYCSLEVLQGMDDPKDGIPAILSAMKSSLKNIGIPRADTFGRDADRADVANVIKDELVALCRALDKPLVIFFDEADCLGNGTLIAFLRQLRNGYITRGYVPFVHSLALVGMRNIRDFKMQVRDGQPTLGSASPFNVIVESLTLRNFKQDEIGELYAQHTADTGQIFESAALDLAWEKTQGQPWLVNAIARDIVEKQLKKNYALPVTAPLVAQAVQTLILRRDVHIDSLLERLKEPRVREIMQPLMIGDNEFDRMSNNFNYVRDLGLIRVDRGKVEPANPIYGEVMARTLSWNTQAELSDVYQMPRYFRAGEIAMTALLEDFQKFWRENGAMWIERYEYKEAAPHLILMAFLQRVVNGGGEINREMAAASGRLDLCVIYQGKKYPVEVKLRYSPQTYAEGVEQISGYMETLNCARGWLVVFDRRPKIAWSKKLFIRQKQHDGKTITIVGA